MNAMTNFEKIKSLSVQQMVDFMLDTMYNGICDYCNHRKRCDYHCLEDKEIISDWLESEADSD